MHTNLAWGQYQRHSQVCHHAGCRVAQGQGGIWFGTSFGHGANPTPGPALAPTHLEADAEGALEMHINYVLSTGQCCFKHDITFLLLLNAIGLDMADSQLKPVTICMFLFGDMIYLVQYWQSPL